MVRGALIGMIYSKATELKSANINESSAMTLMGTDVETIAENWYFAFTESWASVLQIGIGVWLLQRQIGAVCIAPIIVAVGE
jgi:ATP-binding cassette subfamily C (CFTR/MRP) protein 1